jgi:acetyl esterase
MYFHGAGWVMGDAATHDRLVRELAVGPMRQSCSSTTTAHPSTGIQWRSKKPMYAATCYVTKHAEEFEVDATRLAVAGDSVGGNMATVVCLFSKQRSGPRIVGQLLFYPVTNTDFEAGSYKQFTNGPWLSRRAMQWFWDEYLPDHGQRKDPTASPLLASSQQLAGSLRTLIITAENDVLRAYPTCWVVRASMALPPGRSRFWATCGVTFKFRHSATKSAVSYHAGGYEKTTARHTGI